MSNEVHPHPSTKRAIISRFIASGIAAIFAFGCSLLIQAAYGEKIEMALFQGKETPEWLPFFYAIFLAIIFAWIWNSCYEIQMKRHTKSNGSVTDPA